jgi:hypothetical protein
LSRFVCGDIWIILKYLPPIILGYSAYNYSTMLNDEEEANKKRGLIGGKITAKN